ncbi:MAG: hypothetical protein IKU58_04755 [Clostridia bacterium]|nr:hypothetical protein [Clostridia bacterium]
MRYIRLTALILSLVLLTGCSIIPFQTPEEQRAALEAAEARREESQARIDPAAELEGDYIINRTLTNSVGVTLATYQAAFPRFSVNGLKANSFARINSYFSSESSGLVQDAESFFSQVKAYYGPDWDTVTEATTDFAVSITYELLNAPQEYLSVRTDISICEHGQTETYPRAQVFLLDNGWKLSLETLLGSYYDEAAPMLLADILEWCGENGIVVTGSGSRTLEEFSENFALTREGFLFYTDSFALNNKNANRYTIPVDLERYVRMLGQ